MLSLPCITLSRNEHLNVMSGWRRPTFDQRTVRDRKVQGRINLKCILFVGQKHNGLIKCAVKCVSMWTKKQVVLAVTSLPVNKGVYEIIPIKSRTKSSPCLLLCCSNVCKNKRKMLLLYCVFKWENQKSSSNFVSYKTCVPLQISWRQMLF